MINIGGLIFAMSAFAYLMAVITGIFSYKKQTLSKWVNIFSLASAVLITFDMILLVYYQVIHDFHYAYVYGHTSTDLAPAYLVSALWAGQEGSFLLWAVINSWIGFVFLRGLDKRGFKNISAFIGFSVINMSIMVMAILSRPFKTMNYLQVEGLGLNTALQDPWMVVHPPLVFIGYSSMAVLFSIGLCVGPEIEDSCEKLMLRKWALMGWFFLGLGIFTGSIWAYRALGWGGYWAWDPIENAALIPWLLLAGICHEGRLASKPGSRVRYMLPFVMAAFGTFLARSGILKDKSVHSYTVSSLSIPLLIFLAVLVMIILYFSLSKAKKGDASRRSTGISILSILNVNLYAFAVLIFLGTIFPLISGVAVPMAFFNYSALIFSMVLVILFIAQYYVRFKENCFEILFISAIITAAICLIMKFTSLTWMLVLWVFLIPLVLWMVNILRTKPKLRIKMIKDSSAAMAHIGVILLILGVITSTALSKQGTILATDGSLTNLGYGAMIDGADLNKESSTIIHTIGSDIILSPVDSELSLSAVKAVNYTTRPLIWLFWIGGILIILGNLGALLKSYNFPCMNQKK